MEPLIILQGITFEQLPNRFDALLEKRLAQKLAILQPPKTFTYMSRKEVAETLQISLPTLHHRTKEGFLVFLQDR